MKTSLKRRVVFLLLTSLCSVAVAFGTTSQEGVWAQIDKAQVSQRGIDSLSLPNSFEAFRLNPSALQAVLNDAPEEFTNRGSVILTMPMPDGTFARFQIEHSLVVEPGLLANFPELGATYRGHGIDDPTATARFDFLPAGFHAMILSASGTVVVDPSSTDGSDTYISYFKRERPVTSDFKCDVGTTDKQGFDSVTNAKDPSKVDFLPDLSAPEVISGSQLRTYRLAVAATNEYCSAVGSNTVAASLAAQVLIMNRVNGVYERDVAIHMNIVANNNLLIFAGNNLGCPVPGGTTACTAANDPYTNNDGIAMLSQNQSTVDSLIGSGNYDIGHVFSTGGGGVAFLGVPCGGSKAGGVTGLPNPVGDPFAIDYVAHEMGHQWGAGHTFNTTIGSCSGNRSAGSAYEPGSGITIMGYAGICGSQNLAGNSIDTFHVKSLEVITAYSQTGGGNACALITPTGNTPPTVTGPGNFNIPKQTPFFLTATSSDPNGDIVTYDWQEYDLGAAATTIPNSDVDGATRPIFRPFLPTTGGTRTFPAMNHILNSGNVPPTITAGFLTGELLPAITRTMTFQVVARDNRANGGGINTATSLVTIDGNSGPFAITAPNTNITYGVNTVQPIQWNVANTSGAPVNAANVKVSMSTDGGTTFPIVLAASTANDGNENVTMPGTPTTTGRIKVEAVGNIFFDISNANFTVTDGPTPTPT
ncbi:MAG: zinc-dependent metalloprotease, partial [Pyrinomonadaceae bacterium]